MNVTVAFPRHVHSNDARRKEDDNFQNPSHDDSLKMSQPLNPLFAYHRKLLEFAQDHRPYVVVQLDKTSEPTALQDSRDSEGIWDGIH
jgi:hypothetical protein